MGLRSGIRPVRGATSEETMTQGWFTSGERSAPKLPQVDVFARRERD
jgi:hypothetical protein